MTNRNILIIIKTKVTTIGIKGSIYPFVNYESDTVTML